ncbi:MAG: DUF4397 domain-containing protein [Gammaproteobacteria bacterium]|nr:DUF4397 domain-containing protein [Gammaproteobacteria bacterium]
MSRPIFKATISGVVLLSAFMLGGCNDDDNNTRSGGERTVSPAADGVARLRVFHAVADAPNVNVLANGNAILTNVPYGAASALLGVNPATYNVQVDGILPGGTTTVIGPAGIPLGDADITNVLAVNTLAAIEPLVVTVPDATIGANSVRLTVVHGAVAAPAVDVHVTAPADLLGEPVGSFVFRETLGPVTVPTGSYRVRVTLAGTENVVFDTGAGGLTLSGGSDLFLAAIANTGPGASPIQLLVADGEGSAILRDAATPAALKVVHAAPTVGDAEVFVSSASLGLNDVELVDTIEYLQIIPSASSSVNVDAAHDYRVKVAQAGTGADAALIDVAGVALNAGTAYTVVATGGSNGAAAQLLLTADDNRAIATEARVKVVHAAPDAGVVDVYVNAAGTVSPAEILNGDVAPALDNFAFSDITPYLSLAAGDYDIRVVAGDGTLLAIDTSVTLSNGLVATAIAHGPDAVDNTPAGFGLLLTTN